MSDMDRVMAALHDTQARLVSIEGRVLTGVGSPEGVVAAPVGRIYQRTDGGASTTFYVKESGGTGNTGWRAV